VPRVKPAPDLFLLAALRLGVAPEACLVFEDSRNGILAARAAGMRCVAVPNDVTRPLDLGGPDLVLATAADAPLADIARRVGFGLPAAAAR
jgi:beta-phosphoglucomutase-like phosphatase (HAD superfamily)